MKRKLLFTGCFILFSLYLIGQRTYYIYLQADNQQPFFLKMNNRVYSSTASGYLILSKLKDTTHTFSIGFPMREGEFSFYTTMNHKDHGYLIKNFGENGWGLFDLQTLGVQMPSKIAVDTADMVIKTERIEPNDFTQLLSKAANDTTLNQKIIIIHEPKEKVDSLETALVKKDSLFAENKAADVAGQPVEKKEISVEKAIPVAGTAVVAVTDSIQIQPEEKTIIAERKPDSSHFVSEKPIAAADEKKDSSFAESKAATDYKPSKVFRRSESSTTEGLGLVFIDEYPDGKKDTIRVLIPRPRQDKTPPAPVKKEEPAKENELNFINLSADTAGRKRAADKSEGLLVKNDCRQVASEDDFFRLRKEMAAAITSEKMIAEARKEFKSKCFTTGQIRNLGALFLSDEGKYSFFDAAFYFVSDIENYSLLEAELKDELYISRFRELIKK